MQKPIILALMLAATAVSAPAFAGGANDGANRFPPPGSIELTRRNYDEVIHRLADLGLNRQQIHRWVQASLDLRKPDRPIRERPARDRPVRDRVAVDRPVRDVRPVDARPVDVRPVDVSPANVRPVQIARPSRAAIR